MSEPLADAFLTPHALSEMKRRNIDIGTVVGILNAPEQRSRVRAGRDVLQGRIIADGKTYLVRVFVDIDRDPPAVVTVYRTSKVDKYWSPGS